uniref:uncharacterized protein LOC105352972 n=1 Tax=Fragaria vesca subsp. vesca TaxID=101020 RepID=UPI0005CA8E37|nr:PREDICTED: uncharacterized protein LOC105352972 [Fragaria vesca subsp. vesca]
MHRARPEQARLVKCNSDGAYIAGDVEEAAYGVVLRNDTGDFMAGAAKPRLQLTSPFHAELLALLEDAADLSSLGMILDEAKEIMNRHPDFILLIHAQRGSNRVAYILANHAQTSCDESDLVCNCSRQSVMIRDVILNDCNC